MTLSQLLDSLSDAEREFIAGLDHGADRAMHRLALDTVIERQGDVDFEAQGNWYPYEVVELGKNWLQQGHEREYAACIGIVLQNIEAGRDRSNDPMDTLEQFHDTIQALPHDLREMINSQAERIIKKLEQEGAGNSHRVDQYEHLKAQYFGGS